MKGRGRANAMGQQSFPPKVGKGRFFRRPIAFRVPAAGFVVKRRGASGVKNNQESGVPSHDAGQAWAKVPATIASRQLEAAIVMSKLNPRIVPQDLPEQ
jgi:hypothetical protein